MSKPFRCKRAEALYLGKPTNRFRGFQSVAERKLQMLDIPRRIGDLRIPPANRLKASKGDYREQISIRIDDEWRLCVHFEDGNAYTWSSPITIEDRDHEQDATHPYRRDSARGVSGAARALGKRPGPRAQGSRAAHQRHRARAPRGHAGYGVTALAVLGTSPEFWTDLQTALDLKTAANDSGGKIEAEISPRAA